MRKFMGLLLAAVVFGMFTTGAFAANGTSTHRHHARTASQAAPSPSQVSRSASARYPSSLHVLTGNGSSRPDRLPVVVGVLLRLALDTSSRHDIVELGIGQKLSYLTRRPISLRKSESWPIHLRFRDLHVSIEEKQILKGVNLVVRKGEVHALMGPNGSGKSTLANAILGHPKYTVTGGKILMKGENILEMETDERARKGLFLAFQYPCEVPGVRQSNFLRLACNARAGRESM